MQEANMRINTDEARIWAEDVRSEIEAVETLMGHIERSLEHEPDDDIWFEYERIVNNLKNQWEHVISAFRDATRTLNNVVSAAATFGQEVIDDIKASASKLGL